MGSLLMKLSQSNNDLWLPDCYLVRSYLIATVNFLLHNCADFIRLRPCNILLYVAYNAQPIYKGNLLNCH